MNLHEINTMFGELDDATKGALMLAHHNGAVIEMKTASFPLIEMDPCWADNRVYRVRPPAPVVVPKTFHGSMSAGSNVYTYRSFGEFTYPATFTFPTIDGKHVAGVYTSPAGHTITIEVAE